MPTSPPGHQGQRLPPRGLGLLTPTPPPPPPSLAQRHKEVPAAEQDSSPHPLVLGTVWALTECTTLPGGGNQGPERSRLLSKVTQTTEVRPQYS